MSARARTLQKAVVVPGGHCGKSQIAWPNMSWGMDYAAALGVQLLAATAGSGSRAAFDSAPKIVFWVHGPGDLLSTGNYWSSADAWPMPTPTP